MFKHKTLDAAAKYCENAGIHVAEVRDLGPWSRIAATPFPAGLMREGTTSNRRNNVNL
jgi:hypothetical protein